MSGWLLPIAFGIVASLTTLAGGLLAFRLADRMTAVLAIAAGVVLGVAFFDLLPEALKFAEGHYTHRATIALSALGFGGYLLLNRLLATAEERIRWQAHLGPASLTLHSFLDGLLMGMAFQIAPEIGWAVALAVLTHDLADGVNTVSLALSISHRGMAVRWLVANGLAPLGGVVVGLLIRLDDAVFAPLLAIFAGVFLFIGACELIPRSLARDGRLRTTWAVLAGIAMMMIATMLAE